MNLILIIILMIIFIVIIASYAFNNLDFVAISLLCCFIGALITTFFLNLSLATIISYIEFEVIITILSMSIITKIAQDSQILEYLAIKLYKVSKGNERLFFYLLCIIATLLAAIITDVIVVLILAPVVIRLCRALKTHAGTYLLGMTICINIGSIITPFSSGENIMISNYFQLDTIYFIQYYWLFSFFLLFLTIFIMDKFILKKDPEIDNEQKELILDFLDAKSLIKNKKIFYFNAFSIVVTIILFAVFPPLLFFIAAVSAIILVLINKIHTKKQMREILSEIEWEIIFFFISLYVVIGCILAAGFREIFEVIPFEIFNAYLLCFLILIMVSLISGFVANTPTTLIFIPIVDVLIVNHNFPEIPLLFALIIGVNLGGNIIPQGAACDMMTLKIAVNEKVKNFDYKRLLKTGFLFALLHILISMGYLFILIFIFG